MSLSDIVNTPIHLILTATLTGEDDNRPSQDIDLGAPASVFWRAAVIGKLPAAQQPEFSALLTTPLDGELDAAWTSQRAAVGTLVQQAIVQSTPGAYDVIVVVPEKGTLRAEVVGLSPSFQPLFPPGTTGKQLNLSYAVPGFTGLFSKTTDGIFGSWADPTFSFSFDGELRILIGVPSTSATPIAEVGPTPQSVVSGAVFVEFATHNTQGAPEGIGAWLDVLGDIIGAIINGQPLPSGASDQTVNVALGLLGDLADKLVDLSTAFAAAANAGFTALEPEIIIDASTGNNAIAFHLTHPFDPAPAVFSTSSPVVPSLFQPVIGPSVPVVNAGGALTVIGNYFPFAQADQLAITWTDTSSGPPQSSTVEWGQYVGKPASPAPAPTIPASPHSVTIARTGRYDGLATFTTPKTLAPSTWYGFRVSDLDIAPLVGTRWSPWTPFETAATDAVDLRLDYGMTSAALGSAVLSSNGVFALNVTIPAAVPPGTYPIWAAMGGQDMAFAPIRVLGVGAQIPTSLQFLDSLTGTPIIGTAGVQEELSYTLQGLSFAPGAVRLYLDTVGGTLLATGTANATGLFKATISWPFGVLGQHAVVGVDTLNQQATAPVFAQMKPR